ncbi:MAG: hypothetical protein ABI895_17475 [Deltaproteobacteria bacterium]
MLLDPELQGQVAAIFEKYPSLFDSCDDSSTSLGRGRQALIDASETFTCKGSCIPSAAVVQKTLEAIFDAFRQQANGPTGKLLSDLYDQATKVSEKLKNVSSTTQALDQAMTLDEAEQVIDKIAKTLLVGAAAVVFARAFPQAGAELAKIVTIWAAVTGGKAIADELWKAGVLVGECRDFQRDKCGAGCMCSVEVIQYSAGDAVRACGQWRGSGARPFCTAFEGGADCCTCNEESRDKVQSCSRDLSFKADATSGDYEKCCADANAFLNPKAQIAPSCPCQPPSAAASDVTL